MTRMINSPVAYWFVQTLLVGPLLILWAGVAYWFGFSSGVILRFVFPPLVAPMVLLIFPAAALVWTVVHFRRTPRERQFARAADAAVCLFLLFSMLIVAGQFAGQ